MTLFSERVGGLQQQTQKVTKLPNEFGQRAFAQPSLQQLTLKSLENMGYKNSTNNL